MSGNFPRRAIPLTGVFAALLLVAACARNVKQDSASGKDYRAKGAKTLELEDGEGRARDIVTYPGGDRVDWKVFALPEGKKGDLRIKLKWRPPRPGLDLAFDVYDEYFDRIERVKPSRDGKRTKSVKIKNASGKYYVMVYASERGDAGKYTLSVRFKERKQIAQVDPELLVDQIDDPPTLPAVPEAEEPPPGGQTPPPGGDGNPTGPGGAGTPGDPGTPGGPGTPGTDPTGPGSEDPQGPIKARITNMQLSSSGSLIITINKGTRDGVQRGWTGAVLRGDGSDFLPGGDFKVADAFKSESIAKVKLTVDQIKANRYVTISPP